MDAILSRPVSAAELRAVAIATAAGLVTRAVAKVILRARPEGPNLYWVTAEVMRCPGWVYRLVGATFALSKFPAGASHRAFAKAARDEIGRPEAHAAFHMAHSDRVQITHPADAKYILAQQGEEFVKPRFVKVLAPILGVHGLVLITDEAEHTRQFRNVSHAFAPAAVRAISETTVAEKTREAIGALENDVGAAGKVSVIHEWLTDTTLAMILEAAFGVKDAADFPAAAEYARKLNLKMSPLMLLPPWLYLRLPLARHRADAKARSDLSASLKPFIDSYRGRNSDNASAHGKKLIDLLAENPSLTDVEILDHTGTFVLAGHETTANGLNWLFQLLAMHPDVQETLAEELATAFARDVVPSLDTVQKLPYLEATILEGLRLRSPVVALSRCSPKDHILPGSGTYLPANTNVYVPLYVLHVDPTVWGEDAEEFRPERWIDDPELKQRVQGSSYLPFGLGKRACIGKELAINEMLTLAAVVLRRFVLSWPEGQDQPQGVTGLVVRPTAPFKLRLAKRAE